MVTLILKLYIPVTVHREQSVKKEYQQDATIYIGDLLSIPHDDY